MSPIDKRYYVVKTTYNSNNIVHYQSLQAGPLTEIEAYAKALDMTQKRVIGPNVGGNEIYTILEMVSEAESS